ncbi:MAG: benzoyl-CoA-dihydrodiol lyase [Burkholderiales bacterium]|nr:benzoyl-CoA-dihydrodiol lyase [Burkholderiales bacterium]
MYATCNIRNELAETDHMITFDTHPDRYRHWKLSFQGTTATLAMDIDEDQGLKPGYKLKLNSYDLGVDIELHDAIQRIRFEHPEVKTVVLTSAKARMFCSGANIYMLGSSTHAWKVNFCKFTNETRNGMEDASQHSGLKFLAALNGITAGGGYELALACDEILMIDDRSSVVSLPEVPLLGVLPGTGGLTRVIDKRQVRRDHADIFCTMSEGLRADRAKAWKLIDHSAKAQEFSAAVDAHAARLADLSDRPGQGAGVTLTPIARTVDDAGYHYRNVDVAIDRKLRTATLTLQAPAGEQPADIGSVVAAGGNWWPLELARELDDAILLLRTNELEIGTWLLKSRGDVAAVLAADVMLDSNRDHWFVRETIGMLRRTLARLDVTSRTLFAIVDQESCFAGTLLEVLLACDRSYMLSLPDQEDAEPQLALSALNFGSYPMVNHASRLSTRFYGDASQLDCLRALVGKSIRTEDAATHGLVTVTPDDIDWDEEIRIAIEERVSLSPDALTGLEASLRFGGAETMETRIFGRLSAWQNWIFIRPNAVGESGALKVFGTGNKAQFNWERV